MYPMVDDGCRTWKPFDGDATNRLHQQRFIEDPADNRIGGLHATGLNEAERLFNALFAKK